MHAHNQIYLVGNELSYTQKLRPLPQLTMYILQDTAEDVKLRFLGGDR